MNVKNYDIYLTKNQDTNIEQSSCTNQIPSTQMSTDAHQSAWLKFEHTGSIADYLQYKNSVPTQNQ